MTLSKYMTFVENYTDCSFYLNCQQVSCCCFEALHFSQQLWSCPDGQFTLSLGKLDLAVNQYFVHILPLVIDNNPP